jgi:hypothetical protein
MASVRRKRGSSILVRVFQSSRRIMRSAFHEKKTDRKKAQPLADTFEQPAHERITARQAQRVITEIFKRTNGDSLPSASIRTYFESWLVRKKAKRHQAPLCSTAAKLTVFSLGLGTASRDLFALTPADLVAFTTSEASRLNPTTVDHKIKVLRMVFEDAKRDGIISDNPADAVKLMKRTNGTPRRPFTLPESRNSSRLPMQNGAR